MQKGDVILVCTDPEVEARVAKLKAQLQEVTLRARQAMVEDAGSQIYEPQIIAVQEHLNDAQRQMDELTIRAPLTGTLIAPEIHQLRGRFIPPGQEIGMVATMDRLLIRAALDQRDVQLASKLIGPDGKLQRFVNPGGHSDRPVTAIRLAGDTNNVIRCDDAQLIKSALPELPHASLGHAGGGDIAMDPRDEKGTKPIQKQFELRVALANPNAVYLPGQRAFVRVEVDRKPLIWQWGIRFLQLIEARSSEAKWL
jgi:putative peptide zinc metalloprotease protein